MKAKETHYEGIDCLHPLSHQLRRHGEPPSDDGIQFTGGTGMMKWRVVAGSVGLVLAGTIIGAFLGRIGPRQQLRFIAQYDLLHGYALMQAATRPGTLTPSGRQELYNQGLGALVMSQDALNDVGVYGDGAVGYIQGTQDALLRGRATAHERTVFQVFFQSFAPFRDAAFGTIPNARLQQAFNRVDHAIQR